MPYDVGKDPYLDPETGVLRNLLEITTQDDLDAAEARLTAVEITALMTGEIPPYYEFDLELFFNVHRQIFQDIYDWAGKLRTVEVSKGKTSFARMQYLQKSLEDIFRQLEKDEYLVGLGNEEFVEKLAKYYGDLIVAHPFREGNGRATRTFLGMLAESVGWHIAWDEMDPDENIQASIAAYNGDEMPMRVMLGRFVTPVDVFWGREPYEFI